MFEQLSSNQCHISGARIMIRIMQTIRICKMRIISTQFFTSYIHLLHKPVVIMSGIFTDICPDCVRSFICRCKKCRIQRLFQRDLIPFFQPDGGIARLNKGHAVFRKYNRIIHLAILQCNQCCQHLCDTSRIFVCVNVFRIQNRTCTGIHHNSGLSVSSWSFRPALDLVRLDLHLIDFL